MENILADFNSNDLKIKLTSDKIYITTENSNEVFALHSINGIGIVDLNDDYNIALSNRSAEKQTAIIKIILGSVFLFFGFVLMKLATFIGLPILIVGFFVVMIGIVHFNQTNYNPILMSALRLMMNGNNRDFQFNNTEIKSGTILEFISKVEKKLTEFS